MRVLTNLIKVWDESENKILFERVFIHHISEIKAHTISLLIQLYNSRIDKKDAFQFVTRNVNLKIFEDRAYDFLTK